MHWVYGRMWGGVSMLLFWVLIIAGVVWLVRGRPYGPPGAGSVDSALEILRRRYASGEISKEEYQEIKAELNEK